MSDLITLDSTDPKFNSYLWGSFSDQHRALPLTSLNVQTQQERITFQIKQINQIESPAFLKKWLLILRFQNWIFCLFPLLVVLLRAQQENFLRSPMLAITSLVGAFFLFLAMNLRNDVNDHLRGLDRILPHAGNQAIQKGWIAAHQLQKLSRLFFAAGLILGVPAVIAFPQLLILIGLMVVASFWILTSKSFALKYKLSGEFIMFLIMGPLLTTGFQISFGGPLDLQTFLIGILCGGISLFWIHCKNFLFLMESSQANLQNTVSLLGFEKAKYFLTLWWLGLCGLTVLYKMQFSSLAWAAVGFLILGAASFRWIRLLNSYDSPVGSQAQSFLSLTSKLTQTWFAVWLLEVLVVLL